MNTTLQNSILKELCPEGIWQLTDAMKLTLDYQISRLPRRIVSDLETRYPTTLADMRAFLEVFFTRHLFQVQNSLIDYMTSEDFLSIAASGHLRILDIGSGPAVASLAITDVLSCILEHLERVGVRPKGKIVEATYILNDTSGVCLGTGQDMLNNYFRIGRGHITRIVKGRMFSIGRAFPDNINQLERIKLNLGTYDIVVFSYVISPLNEERGFDRLINGLLAIKELCRPGSRILILQDKFRASLVRRVSRAIGVSSRKDQLTQFVYPSRNSNETYTYSYYRCLYAPIQKVTIRRNCVA